jgi:hypothetical protein
MTDQETDRRMGLLYESLLAVSMKPKKERKETRNTTEKIPLYHPAQSDRSVPSSSLS